MWRAFQPELAMASCGKAHENDVVSQEESFCSPKPGFQSRVSEPE